MVDARVKGSKVPVSVVAPRSGVHFEVARLLRAARQGVVVATGLTVFAPGSADAQVTCPAPTPCTVVWSRPASWCRWKWRKPIASASSLPS